MWLKFIKFNYLLPKSSAFLSAWEILGLARFLAGFCHLALLCRSCKRYEKFFKITRKAPATKLFIAKQPRIDRTTRAIKQNIHRMLHGKNFQFYCTNLAAPPFPTYSSFSKIYTKSSKKCGLLATLVKFNQASDPHPPHQQKFVKNERSIYTV